MQCNDDDGVGDKDFVDDNDDDGGLEKKKVIFFWFEWVKRSFEN